MPYITFNKKNKSEIPRLLTYGSAGRVCRVNAILRDASGLEDGVEVGGIDVDPAGRVRAWIAVDVDGDTAGQVVGAVVAAAGLAQVV